MITVSNIENVQSVRTSPQGERSAHKRHSAGVQATEPIGRAVATQRDAFYFRSDPVVHQSTTATATYLAQQISQLWPTSPTAVHKTAAHAYAQNSVPFGGDRREESVLA